jgi:hypothetical protein
MQKTFYASNPTVRVQSSTPTPQPSPHEQLMLAQRPFVGSGGQFEFPGAGHLYTVQKSFGGRYHKRSSTGSASSIASLGPPSPHSHNTGYPHIATDFPPYDQNYDYMHTPPSAQTSKSLPTPTTEHYMYQPQSTTTPYSAVDMRRIHSAGGDDNASYVSSMSHNSPSTPHTNYEVDYDDSKNIYNGEIKTDEQWMDEYLPPTVGYQPTAAFQQSLQDVFPDQPAFQNPMAFQQQMAPRTSGQQAAQNMMMNRLQAARQDHLRTSSPVTSNPREKSPFRQNSPLVMAESMRAPTQRPQQQIPTLHKTRTSVSPKELMIDEHDVDDAGPPLFQDQSPQQYSRRQPQNMSSWYTPSLAQEPTVQIPQQYPFVSQQSQSQGQADQTPDFPAHLISMESTQEDGPSEPSSQQSQSRSALSSKSQPVTRPADTTSDGGTYSCTYHGCPLRFESALKLQRHKREGHRQHSPTHTQSIAERNSQAGPHKCERINPSTGKPCNSIFSRPYDLTRHEDTIHNNRKMKVRCHLCTEEKTFSRNDALTRHMRVVHPDVEFTGKPKKHSSRA